MCLTTICLRGKYSIKYQWDTEQAEYIHCILGITQLVFIITVSAVPAVSSPLHDMPKCGMFDVQVLSYKVIIEPNTILSILILQC